MNSTDKFDYFMKRTEQDLAELSHHIDQRFTKVELKLDDLWLFRVRTAGILVGASSIISVLVSVLIWVLKELK